MGTDTKKTEEGEVIDLTEARSNRRAPGNPVPGADGEADRLVLDAATLLNSTLELREVLRRLADLALQTSGAQRASIFLLEGHVLRPTVAIGRSRNEDLWATFQDMGPVRLADIPSARQQLGQAASIPVEDAASSELIPREWAEHFDLRSLVLVPLRAVDEPCGLLVVDHATRRSFTAEDLRPLEALGACAGVAVRNARLYDTARQQATRQKALARGTSALVSHDDTRQVLSALTEAFADLTGAELCAVGLFDDDLARITTVSSTSGPAPVGAIPFTDIPTEILDELTEAWSTDARQPVTFGPHGWFGQVAGQPADYEHHLILPLTPEDRPRGAVVMGFAEETALDAEERRAVRDLSGLASVALERSALLDRLDRHSRHVEALYAISTALLDGADTVAIAERLNGLLAPDGVSVDRVVWRRHLQRRLGGATICDAEAEAWDADPAACVPVDGTLSVPMRLGDEVVGGLRVRPADLDEEEHTFVVAVARGVGEVVNRGVLRATLDEAARERAIGTERDRIAADLHDTVGQLFIAIGLMTRRLVEHLPADSRWRSKLERVSRLAGSGKWEIDQAVRALAFVPGPERDLPAALRELTDSFQSDSGISAMVDVHGDPARLEADVQRALYRVAHEALNNAWRHARCAAVHLSLQYQPDAVALRVRDDGVGLPPRTPGKSLAGIGLTSMRRAVKELDGELHLGNADPHGAEVRAQIPMAPPASPTGPT